MPRSNTTQTGTPARSRSRGPARASTPPRSASNDAADVSTSSSNAGAATADDSGSYSPTYDEIAEAAYQRYLKRGGADGQDFDDWLEAERELRSRRGSS